MVTARRADVAEPLVDRQLLFAADAQGLVGLAARLQDVGDLADGDGAGADVAEALETGSCSSRRRRRASAGCPRRTSNSEKGSRVGALTHRPRPGNFSGPLRITVCPLAVAKGRLHLTKTAHEPVIPADRRDRLLVEVAGLAVTILANPTPPERRGDRGRNVGPAGETPEAGDLQSFRLGQGAAFPPELEQGGRGGIGQGRGVGRAVGGEDRFQEAGDAVVRA